jgi:hypothetical protein
MFEILELAALGCMSVAANMLNVLSRTEVKKLGVFRTLISYLINRALKQNSFNLFSHCVEIRNYRQIVIITVIIIIVLYSWKSIPGNTPSKAWVCSCSFLRIVGSNPAGVMNISLL